MATVEQSSSSIIKELKCHKTDNYQVPVIVHGEHRKMCKSAAYNVSCTICFNALMGQGVNCGAEGAQEGEHYITLLFNLYRYELLRGEMAIKRRRRRDAPQEEHGRAAAAAGKVYAALHSMGP